MIDPEWLVDVDIKQTNSPLWGERGDADRLSDVLSTHGSLGSLSGGQLGSRLSSWSMDRSAGARVSRTITDRCLPCQTIHNLGPIELGGGYRAREPVGTTR